MKRYIAALMAAVMLLTVCCACGDDVKENPEVGGGSERFVTEYEQGSLRVILDAETGERYLLYSNGYGSGLTHLEEQED